MHDALISQTLEAHKQAVIAMLDASDAYYYEVACNRIEALGYEFKE
jgi:hypothetical protein